MKPTNQNLSIIDTLTGTCFIWKSKNEKRLVKLKELCLSENDKSLLDRVFREDISLLEMQHEVSILDSRIKLARAMIALDEFFKRIKSPLLIDFFVRLIDDDKTMQLLGGNLGDEYNEYNNNYFDGHSDRYFVENRSLTEEQITILYERLKHTYPEDPYLTSLEIYPKLPNCPAYILEELLKYSNKSIRKSIAFHWNLNTKVIQFFLTSKRKMERIYLAQSQWTSEDVLLCLSGDADIEVVHIAKYNLKDKFGYVKFYKKDTKLALSKVFVEKNS